MCSRKNSNSFETYRSQDRRWAIHHGDVEQVLQTLPSCTFDGAFLDPPYGIGFMGHEWDKGVPPPRIWQHLLRTCKPGAHLLAFGGTKTFHRLVCSIEDAGWEIRDTLCWLYGEGFPKSHNINKAIRRIGGDPASWLGYGTTLKPAWEPVILAMKPKDGTFASNALKRGCGGLDIDGCRIGNGGGTKRSHQAEYPRLADGTEDRSQWARSGHNVEPIEAGRWPASPGGRLHVGCWCPSLAAAPKCSERCWPVGITSPELSWRRSTSRQRNAGCQIPMPFLTQPDQSHSVH